MSNAWKAVSAGALALAVVLALVLAVSLSQPAEEPDPFGVQTYGCSVYREQGCAKLVTASGGEVEVQSGGTLDVQSGATFNVGSIYPLLNATTGMELVCGVTGVFTASTAVDLSGSLTAVSFAVVTQITAPAATGELVHITAPTTSTLEIISLESDYTAGTTGVNVEYCALGTQ